MNKRILLVSLLLVIILLAIMLFIQYQNRQKFEERVHDVAHNADLQYLKLIKQGSFTDLNPYYSKKTDAYKEIKTREECDRKKGLWKSWSFGKSYSCDLPTSDNGKECHDMLECEGACIMQLNLEQEMKVQGGEIIEIKGQCSQYIFDSACDVKGHEVRKNKLGLKLYCP